MNGTFVSATGGTFESDTGGTFNPPLSHIVANAVDNNGKKIPDNFDRKKSVEICKEITLKNGYTLGEHKSLSEAQDIHSPIDKVKYDLSKKIVAGIEKCTSITFLPEKLAQMGVGCQIKTDSKGLPVGISFSMKAEDKNGNLREYKFAGSHIDKKFSAKNIAIACQLHLSMPSLVNCAYKMTLDYEMDPNDFPMAKREYEILKRVLSRECKARKRLEYEYKDSKKKGIAAVLLTLVLGPPFAFAIPAMYMAMRQSKFEQEYAKASHSIEIILEKVREAKRIAYLISNSKDGTVYPPLNETKPGKQVQQDSETQSQAQEQTHTHRIRMR